MNPTQENIVNIKVQEKYKDILERDTLTGAYNRRGFYSHTYTLIHENQDTEYDICCVNIDKFKVINDLFGAFEGDKLLCYVAKKLRDYTRHTGTYARLTADNFALCIPRSENYYEDFSQLLQTWFVSYPLSINIVARCGFYQINDIEIPVGSMCDRANLAISEIKGDYNRSYAVYDDNIRNRMLQEQEILNEMQYALDDEQFVAYYQPKFNMESGKLIGSEALVRWIHPSKGMVSPGVFIPIFEKNGFISSLDKYVWERVCKDISGWLKAGYKVCPVSVNVSRAELYSKSLPLYLSSLVDKYEIPIDLLQLEITESAYTDSPDQIIEKVQELKSMGFTILMDDFGSGYSSLNTLKDVPVDVLKIDLKFLYNMENNIRANYILKSVVQMAKRLDLYVIAEGVETESQADFLKSIGCVRAQGYLYARPMPKEELEFYLSDPSKVSQTDDEATVGLVNIDDVLAGFHREDELEWYRAAVIRLKAMLFEYDIENDTLMLYDMQLDDASRELSRIEITSFKASALKGSFMFVEDALNVVAQINKQGNIECDIRIRNAGPIKGYRWYHQSGRTLYDSEGNAKSIVGVLRDISDMKADDVLMNTFEAFEKNESNDKEFFDSIFKNINEGYICDGCGFIMLRSPRRDFLGGRILRRDGVDFKYYDKNALDGMDKELLALETDEYGLVCLRAACEENYGPHIREAFFSHGERIVVLHRTEYIKGMPGVQCIIYNESEKELIDSDFKHMSELNLAFKNGISQRISKRIEKENFEFYSNAFDKSELRLWEWDISSRVLRRSAKAVDDSFGEWVENAPESLVEAGLIHPDYVEQYIKAYQELADGYDTCVMVKKLTTEGEYKWLRIDYNIILDEKGKPMKAIGFGEDVNDLFTKQMMVRERIHTQQDIQTGMQSWFKVDLTDDAVVEWSSKPLERGKKEGYDETVLIMANSLIPENDREKFIQNASRQRLIDSYNMGRQCMSYTYPYYDKANGTVHYREVNIDMFRGEDSHIYAFSYLHNIDVIKEKEKYIKSGVEYDDELCVYSEESFAEMVKGIVKNEECENAAFMVVDMDNFLLIRETFGKVYSEEIIANVLAVIKSTLPEETIYGRLYDDRFGIMVLNYGDMRVMFRRFNIMLKRIYSAFAVGRKGYVLSASAGLVYLEFVGRDYDKLMKDALEEMKFAKCQND